MGPVFEVRRVPGAVVLRAVADLDLATLDVAEQQLRSCVGRPGYEDVVIDMTGHFASARGLWLLGEAVATAGAGGRRWRVEGLERALPERIAQTWFPALGERAAPLRLVDGSGRPPGERLRPSRGESGTAPR